MASFPVTIVSPTDPTSGSLLSNPSHSQQHQGHNAEVVAVETKIGTGASTPTANTVLKGTGTGTSAWGTLTSANVAALVTDETGSGSLVFGTSPTIAAPVVSTGAFASPVLTTPAVVTSINDANGNEVIKTPATTSAVNEITVTNAATSAAPTIAPSGNDSAINLNLRGKGLAKSVTIGAGAATIYPYDFIVSGCVITADSVGVNKNYSISSGVVVINGNPITVAAVSAQTVTASKDRYIDVLDNGDGTGVLSTTGGEVTNNAASPALAANSIRIGIVVAGATTIATTGSINQGQPDRVLPIASSIPYTWTDSLGNLICPRDPQRKILGYRTQLTTYSSGTTGAYVDITGMSCPVIVPTGRKIRVTFTGIVNNSTWTYGAFAVREGSTVISQDTTTSNSEIPFTTSDLTAPSSGLHTYVASFGSNGGTTNFQSGTGAYGDRWKGRLMVELV